MPYVINGQPIMIAMDKNLSKRFWFSLTFEKDGKDKNKMAKEVLGHRYVQLKMSKGNLYEETN